MFLPGSVLTAHRPEQFVLSELQEHTRITDKNALATILGNIKQESKFHSNICEGVEFLTLIAIVNTDSFSGPLRTVIFLGLFCISTVVILVHLKVRLYMINEIHFQKVLPEFEGSGKTVQQYMVPAYYWLGWGIKGNREIHTLITTQRLLLA